MTDKPDYRKEAEKLDRDMWKNPDRQVIVNALLDADRRGYERGVKGCDVQTSIAYETGFKIGFKRAREQAAKLCESNRYELNHGNMGADEMADAIRRMEDA